MEAEQPLRICIRCAQWKPPSEFRRRQRGSDENRHHECRDCANAYNRQLRAERRRKAVGDALVQLRRYRDDCPNALERLTAILLSTFNGAVGFAAEYFAAYDAAREAGDHRAVQRYLVGIVDFLIAVHQAAARRTIRAERRKRQQAAQRPKKVREDDMAPALAAEIEAEAYRRVAKLREQYEQTLAKRRK